MGLESGSFIATLVATNPVAGTDYVSQGDDHIRLIKLALQNSFPHISTTVEAIPAELNLLVGATGGLATLSVSFVQALASISAINTLVSQMGTLSTSVTSSDITGSIRTPVLQTTGVSAGTYTAATIVVDTKGRITSASAGTSGFTPSYESSQITLTANTVYTFSHGLSGAPKDYAAFLVNITPEYGYSAGDEIHALTSNSSQIGIDATFVNGTTIGYAVGASFMISNRTTPGFNTGLANWRMILRAWI